MECNRDEAIRAKDISVKKLSEKDIVGARKFALKAQNLYPELEGLSQLLTTLDVYISAEKRINGEVDWYGVLGVEPIADDETLRKHYRKLALTLHPDKNKLIGADGAFKIISEAWSLLSDKAKRSMYDQKRNIRGINQKCPTRNVSMPAGRNGFHNFANGANLNVTNERSASNTKSAAATPGPAASVLRPAVGVPKPAATVSKPAVAVPRVRKQNTFWTVCNRCKMQYEYLINYLNHTLLCPNCHEPFFAVETAPPPLNGRKPSTPWSSFQQQQNSSSYMSKMNSDGPKINTTAASNSGRAGLSAFASSNHENSQSGSVFKSGGTGSAPASSSLPAQTAQAAHPLFNRLKRGREEAERPGASAFSEEGTGLKKRHIDSNSMHATKRTITNQMSMRNEGVILGNVSASQKSSFENTRLNVPGSYRPSITRELSQPDIRSLLMQKAKIEIRKKLNEWSLETARKASVKTQKQKGKEKQEAAATGVKCGANKDEQLGATATSNNFEEQKGKEKQEAGATGVKSVANKDEQLAATAPPNKVREKLSPSGSLDSDSKGPEPVEMNVPDPDFHDFDKDRSEKSFGENQVWAVYDDDDGMPRYYAMIHGVVSKRPFKLRISWLNSKSNNELAPINWIGSGFSKTSGDFRVGKYELNNNLNSFSHRVKWAKGARGVIHIYPSKGEVWALFRNWSPDWNELTPDEVIHKYDMFEVLEDYNEGHGVTVIPLAKVSGFRTVFCQHSDPSQVRTIPREELFRFSHQVPSYLLTGAEAQNAPKGCRELDPAATPLELLQVITEVKGKVIRVSDDELNSSLSNDVKEATDGKKAVAETSNVSNNERQSGN